MAASVRQNPFEFGGELKATSLVDREQELNLVIRTIAKNESSGSKAVFVVKSAENGFGLHRVGLPAAVS